MMLELLLIFYLLLPWLLVIPVIVTIVRIAVVFVLVVVPFVFVVFTIVTPWSEYQRAGLNIRTVKKKMKMLPGEFSQGITGAGSW